MIPGILTCSAIRALEIDREAKHLRYMQWFEVAGSRGVIAEDKVACYQVIIKIGFFVDSPEFL